MGMDGRGGCCIARYGGGAHDLSKLDRIMLRFRPIAPKPAVPGDSVSRSSMPENTKSGYGKRCGKDRNSSVKKRFAGRKRKGSPESHGRTTSSESVSGGETLVTLPLLPEMPDVVKESPRKASPVAPPWLSFGSLGLGHLANGWEDLTAAMAPQAVRRGVMASWVKVECITDKWENCYGCDLGRTDEERVMNLDRDTCPGFVSDGLNRVRWTNMAYKQMVVGEAVARLVIDEGVALPVGCTSFTCRVRVGSEKHSRSSLTVPCDVWRMECGGFAWRLDTNAALSLGR